MGSISDIIQSPIVGTIIGSTIGGIGTYTRSKSNVVITPNDSSRPTIYFQFDPEWGENYGNKIEEFTPVLGDLTYPLYVSRGSERFSLSGVYYAVTASEAKVLEKLADDLRNISAPEDGALPYVNIDFPFKAEFVMAYIEGLELKYGNKYVYKEDLPRRIDFTLNFIQFNRLPTISSMTMPEPPALNNYDVKDSRRGDRRNHGGSVDNNYEVEKSIKNSQEEATEEEFVEPVD